MPLAFQDILFDKFREWSQFNAVIALISKKMDRIGFEPPPTMNNSFMNLMLARFNWLSDMRLSFKYTC